MATYSRIPLAVTAPSLALLEGHFLLPSFLQPAPPRMKVQHRPSEADNATSRHPRYVTLRLLLQGTSSGAEEAGGRSR